MCGPRLCTQRFQTPSLERQYEASETAVFKAQQNRIHDPRTHREARRNEPNQYPSSTNSLGLYVPASEDPHPRDHQQPTVPSLPSDSPAFSRTGSSSNVPPSQIATHTTHLRGQYMRHSSTTIDTGRSPTYARTQVNHGDAATRQLSPSHQTSHTYTRPSRHPRSRSSTSSSATDAHFRSNQSSSQPRSGHHCSPTILTYVATYVVPQPFPAPHPVYYGARYNPPTPPPPPPMPHGYPNVPQAHMWARGPGPGRW